MTNLKNKKLRLRIFSDLHIDGAFGRQLKDIVPIDNESKEEILINAGDFINGAYFRDRKGRKERFQEFEELANSFKKAIYIFGNHEHYGGANIEQSIQKFRSHYPKSAQITFLENDWIHFQEEDVFIFGGTMWVGLNLPEAEGADLSYICTGITDFKSIHAHSLGICKLYYYDYFQALKTFFDKAPIKDTSRVVIISHFGPFIGSIHPRYRLDPYNSYFSSHTQLEARIRNRINLWIHGHTHESLDYVHKETDESKGIRVICNPYGYASEIQYNPYKPILKVEV